MNRDHVAVVTVADITALTRHDRQAGLQVRDDLLQAADDDRIKAIVLRGLTTEQAEEPVDRIDPAAWQAYTGVRGLYQIATYCKKVLIAEVDGACVGAGSALCLAADFVVATERSTFVAPFARVPEASYVLALLTMRANRAKAWTLNPRGFDANAAAAAGLVNEIVSPDLLQETSESLGFAASLTSLDGLTTTKMNVNASFDAVGVGREFDAIEVEISSGALAVGSHG